MKRELETEYKIYREYVTDGHIELCIGLWMIVMPLCIMVNKLVGAIVPMLLLVPILMWQKWVRLPRFGLVEFSPDFSKWIKRNSLFHTLTYGACWWAILGLLVINQEYQLHWLGDGQTEIAFFGGMETVALMICVAIFRRAKRFYWFAAINAVYWYIALYYEKMFLGSFFFTGGILAISGGILLWRYLKRHPKIDVPQGDPIHPPVAAEFAPTEERQLALLKYYLSDGFIEFIIAGLYITIGARFWELSWKSGVSIIAMVTIPSCWRYFVTRRKMTIALYEKAAKIDQSRGSAWLAPAFMLPYFIIITLPQNVSQSTSQLISSYLDVVIVAFTAIEMIVANRVTKIDRISLPLISIGALYLALRAFQLPLEAASVITAALAFVLGLKRAIAFMHTPVPELGEET